MENNNNTGRDIAPTAQREMLPAIIQTNGQCRFNVVTVDDTDIFCENWYKTNGIICLEGARIQTPIESTIDQTMHVQMEIRYKRGILLSKASSKKRSSMYGKPRSFYTIPEKRFEGAASYESEEALIEADYEWALRTKEKAIAVANDRQVTENNLIQDCTFTTRAKEEIRWQYVHKQWNEYMEENPIKKDVYIVRVLKRCFFIKPEKRVNRSEWQEDLIKRVKLDESVFDDTVRNFKDEDTDRSQAYVSTRMCSTSNNTVVEVGTFKK
jgi:hypothetical protein